jgi:hypothetical protein
MRPANVVFVIAVVAQWLLPLAGVWRHERILARGTVVRIRCAAPDPYDPLRGRFLAIRPEQTEFPKPDGMPEAGSVPVWATFIADTAGLSTIESLSLEPISGPAVIRLVARFPGWDRKRETVTLEWPVDRFYLNERFAADADRRLADWFRAGKKPVVELRLLDGRAVLADVLMDGVSIGAVVRQSSE